MPAMISSWQVPRTWETGTGCPVDLALQQLGDEVVAGVLLAVLDDLGQEAEQRLAGAQAQRDVGLAELQEPLHPDGEVVGPVARDAHELGDDPGRDLLRVVDRRVGPAPVEEDRR